jgi:hypothetical protein
MVLAEWREGGANRLPRGDLVRWHIAAVTLLVEEDSDGQPRITADLEPGLDIAQLIHLFLRQLPAVELEVALNARLCDRFGDDASSSLFQHALAVSLQCFRGRET